MGYRNIEPVLVNIYSFAQECGLFINETELNGGYGCLSKSKDKSESGCCYTFDCPLAYTPSLGDLKKHDIHLYNEWRDHIKQWHEKNGWEFKEDDEYDVESHGCDWVIQFREVV